MIPLSLFLSTQIKIDTTFRWFLLVLKLTFGNIHGLNKSGQAPQAPFIYQNLKLANDLGIGPANDYDLCENYDNDNDYDII